MLVNNNHQGLSSQLNDADIKSVGCAHPADGGQSDLADPLLFACLSAICGFTFSVYDIFVWRNGWVGFWACVGTFGVCVPVLVLCWVRYSSLRRREKR